MALTTITEITRHVGDDRTLHLRLVARPDRSQHRSADGGHRHEHEDDTDARAGPVHPVDVHADDVGDVPEQERHQARDEEVLRQHEEARPR